MNKKQMKLLEGVSTNQSTNRRRHRNKRAAVDAVFESVRGARPSDALAGMEIQTDIPEPGDDFAPVAGSLEVDDAEIGDEITMGDGMGDELVPAGDEGPAEGGEISQESIDVAVEQGGLKPVSIEGIDMAALEKGADHEMEHVEDRGMAAAIAAHHINKHPDYYEKLESLEFDDESEEDPDLDDYEEVPFGGDEDGEDSEEDEEDETDEPKGDEEGDD